MKAVERAFSILDARGGKRATGLIGLELGAEMLHMLQPEEHGGQPGIRAAPSLPSSGGRG